MRANVDTDARVGIAHAKAKHQPPAHRHTFLLLMIVAQKWMWARTRTRELVVLVRQHLSVAQNSRFRERYDNLYSRMISRKHTLKATAKLFPHCFRFLLYAILVFFLFFIFICYHCCSCILLLCCCCCCCSISQVPLSLLCVQFRVHGIDQKCQFQWCFRMAYWEHISAKRLQNSFRTTMWKINGATRWEFCHLSTYYGSFSNIFASKSQAYFGLFVEHEIEWML